MQKIISQLYSEDKKYKGWGGVEGVNWYFQLIAQLKKKTPEGLP